MGHFGFNSLQNTSENNASYEQWEGKKDLALQQLEDTVTMFRSAMHWVSEIGNQLPYPAWRRFISSLSIDIANRHHSFEIKE